jgi:hypothetical protein
VELVVARPAPVLPAPAPPSPEPRELEGWGAAHPYAPQPQESPKVNVEALTDEVMRAIDRRIVAHRERTGRV